MDYKILSRNVGYVILGALAYAGCMWISLQVFGSIHIGLLGIGVVLLLWMIWNLSMSQSIGKHGVRSDD